MKISRLWLQKYFDAPLPHAEELSRALTFHAFEIDGVEQKGEDDVLDVKVTPNRGHDCLSHRGIAKELSAILKLPLAREPLEHPPTLAPVTQEVSVALNTPLCKRYVAGYMKGVSVGPSPAWLVQRLEAIGQRSINNVVDATNFVMFNTGQPLHAFDAKKLGSLALGVRTAKEGEVMQALDKKEYTLKDSMLVITAGDAPVGIAGVKGGMPAAIDSSTTDIVIESANFDGVSVRKTAAALKLRTDASSRFEQVISPELASYGMQSVVELIRELAGGEVAGYVDVYPETQKETRAHVSVALVNKVLGTTLTGADVADALTRLGFSYKEEAGDFEVVVPFERLDIMLPEDLVEEVGRMVGYEQIQSTPLSPWSGGVEINQNFAAAEAKREELVAQGYSEVFTSVFAEKGERVVLNKVDGVRPYLRSSLVPGLTEALTKNKSHKDLLALTEVKLFEIGVVWKDGKEATMLGTASEKGGVKEELLTSAMAEAYQEFPVSSAERYETFSKYPYIVRDIAMWIPKDSKLPTGQAPEDFVRDFIQQEAGELAVRAGLFDRFEKGDKTSLAFRVVFQSFERTLTEEEANAAMEKVYAAVKAKGFEIR